MPIGIAACLSLLLLVSGMGGVATVCQTGGGMKSAARTTAVQLRGRVANVELVREDASSIVFKLELNLELVNVSDGSVLVLQHPFWLGASRLARSEAEAKANKYLYSSGSWPSVSGAPEWRDLRQRLNQPSPPSDLTRTLAPGESYQYKDETSLYIEKKGSFDKTSLPWELIRQASPVWLEVGVEIWPINVEPKVDPSNPKFGKTLQKRWRQFGQLQIERLNSEPMQLIFPSGGQNLP